MDMIKRNGFPFVICAPSGAGKSTLVRRLCKEFSLSFSISCTTRTPRKDEVDGKDYYFLDRKTFEQKRDNGDFAEWAFVHDNYYGTPLKLLQERLNFGQDVIFEIDVQGAAQLYLSLPNAKFVFIYPPSMAELKDRLVMRATDSNESIERRLANAVTEINASHWFDAWIVNDNLEIAYDRLRAFYLACTLSPRLYNKSLNIL